MYSTFYPDQSHITEAFKGSFMPQKYREDVGAACRELREFIEYLAKAGRLVLSIAHVIETGNWLRTANPEWISCAQAYTHWVETLKPRWVKRFECVLEQEYTNALLKKAGRPIPHPVRPFGDTLTATFPDLPHLGFKGLSQLAVPGLTRNAYVTELPLQELVGEPEEDPHKARRYLQETLTEVARKLHVGADTVSEVVEAYFSDPVETLPAMSVRDAYEQYLRKEVNTPHRNLHKLLSGSMADLQHASIAGGYCDVFTADTFVLRGIKSPRSALGKITLGTRSEGGMVQLVTTIVKALT